MLLTIIFKSIKMSGRASRALGKTYLKPLGCAQGDIKVMNTEKLIKELSFKAIRSSGPGGQHANKVSSKIELSFDIKASKELSDEQKELLLKNISNRLTKENILILFCDESRSQHKNKEIVIDRFKEIIKKGLIVPKKRKATKPSKASIKKRLDSKKKTSIRKSNRRKPDLD